MRARTRICRALLWLYPPRFRREYGASMIQLYTDLERDRVAHPFRRALGELAITVPYQYWEAFMSMTPTTRAVILVAVTAAAVLASIVIGASIIGLLLMLLLAWQLSAILRARSRNMNASWWRFLLAGIGVEVTLMAVYSLPDSWRPRLPFGFFLTLGLISFGIVLMTLGVILAIAEIARRARRAV